MTVPVGNLRHTVAGLMSTITITPSKHHPEAMLDMADQVIAMVLAWIDPAEHDDEEMALADIAADAVSEAAFERMNEHSL